jgi:transcriptional regulator with XRE-family HTH domain
MDIRKVVGKNVQYYRKKKGLSQEELGFEAGIDRTYISGVERGLRNPTVLVLARIAKALGVSETKLLELI